MTNFYDNLPEIDKNTGEYVNYIFERLSGMIKTLDFSAENQLSLNSKKREYTYMLMEKGIKDSKTINRALDKIRNANLTFLPSPAEFFSYCTPTAKDIGAPELDDAYAEACLQAHPQSWKKNWTHPAVKQAYQMTGNLTFLNKPAEYTYNTFSAHYRNAINDFAAGKVVEKLEHKKPLSESDVDIPHKKGGYEFVRPGVLKQYENVKTAEECFAICEKLLGKGDSRLRQLITNLEAQYNQNYKNH